MVKYVFVISGYEWYGAASGRDDYHSGAVGQ